MLLTSLSVFFSLLSGYLCLATFTCVDVFSVSIGDHNFCVGAGRLVWRRHAGLPHPSHHSIRATCMQVLPLVEMYCRWELQEECGHLYALMQRFDSELELETHHLGRSLLFMIRNDDIGFPAMAQVDVPQAREDPFALIRERLAAAEFAIQDLQPQVPCCKASRGHKICAITSCLRGLRHCFDL